MDDSDYNISETMETAREYNQSIDLDESNDVWGDDDSILGWGLNVCHNFALRSRQNISI